MRVALDSNILVYFEGLGVTAADKGKEAVAQALVEHLPADRIAVPAQVLGETFRVLVHKQGLARAEARQRLMAWPEAAAILPTNLDAMARAMALAADHQIPIWDAVILAVAAENGCAVLLSEDFQDGLAFNGTTVVNPFATPPHPLLSQLLPDGPAP